MCVSGLVVCGQHGCLFVTCAVIAGRRPRQVGSPGYGGLSRGPRCLTCASPVPGSRARSPQWAAPVLQRAGYNRPSVTLGRSRVPHSAHVMTVIGSFVQRFAVIRGLGAGGPVRDSRGCGRRYPWCIRMIVQVTQTCGLFPDASIQPAQRHIGPVQDTYPARVMTALCRIRRMRPEGSPQCGPEAGGPMRHDRSCGTWYPRCTRTIGQVAKSAGYFLTRTWDRPVVTPVRSGVSLTRA